MGIEAVYQERALCDQQELFRNIFAGREITNSFGFLDIKNQEYYKTGSFLQDLEDPCLRL